MSSTKGDPPPPDDGAELPPIIIGGGGAKSSSSADIKPPTLTDSGAESVESDPPVGTGGDSAMNSSGSSE